MVVHTAHGLQFEEPSASDIKRLKGSQWCSQLITDPSVRTFNPRNRVRKASTADSLTAETIQSEETIRVWLSFYRAPCPAFPSPYGEYLTIFSIGSGLNGHVKTLHGGAIALLFDETVTLAAGYHASPNTTVYTANLTVDFKKAVETPCIVLCRVWLEEGSSGRKHLVRGTLEDGEGGILCTVRSVCVEVLLPESKL